jgi:hypothetical protein
MSSPTSKASRFVQQDAISRCDHLVCHDFGTCARWGRVEALELFQQMSKDLVCGQTLLLLLGVLNACASIVALDEGKCSHEQIIQSGVNSNGFLGSSLVDTYATCGSMEYA